MFDLFGWLRSRVKSAFLAGVSDAVSEITAGNAAEESAAIQSLKLQLLSADPEDDSGQPASKKSGKKTG